MKRLSPPRIVVLGFLITIIVGTILLSLPWASRDGSRLGVVDALFTATSATCVTGLVVKDTGSFFSLFGQIVILVLFQVGGLGIMTLSTLFAVLLGRKLTIRENVVVQGALDQHKVEGLTVLIKHILLFTLSIQIIGAGLLSWRWMHLNALPPLEAAYQGIFHSISAFCNAGFSLFHDSLFRFRGDLYTNLVMVSLIVLGGLGFVVLLDFFQLRFWPKKKVRFSLQTKIVLSTTVFLIVIGTLLFIILEKDNTLANLSLGEKIMGAHFQSITARTAGFSTLPVQKLATPTLLVIIALMFIGASPGSTGGGIKTSTFCIVLASLRAMMKNRNEVGLFGRTFPREVTRKVIVIFILALVWIFTFTLLLSVVEKDEPFLGILFEVTSAFGTVGLSTGITADLTPLGKILITLTMFVGRIGPLTLALAVALHGERAVYKYPEERVMVG